jgi:hypothetical protein
MCYNMQINVRMFDHVFPPIIWFICQTIVDCLNPNVFTCILNQYVGHWLIVDALNLPSP